MNFLAYKMLSDVNNIHFFHLFSLRPKSTLQTMSLLGLQILRSKDHCYLIYDQ
jgi:hypothetical protein